MDKKWGFWTKASPFQKFVTLRILHRFVQDERHEKLTVWGCAPLSSEISENYLSRKLLLKWFLKNKNLKKVNFSRFRGPIFSGKGVRTDRNFFLGWKTSTRSKTPRQTKKSNETSPWSYKFIFMPQESIIPFFEEKTDFVFRKSRFFLTYTVPYLPEVYFDHSRIGILKTWDNKGCDPVSRNFCDSLK